MAQVLSAFTLHPWSSTWRTSPFFFYLFLLSVTVFLFHFELFLELHYTIVMVNLRCSAAEESEDTLNAFTSLTATGVHKFQKCTNLPTQLQIVHETLTFKIRHFMARPCRAGSQRQVLNTIEFLYNDIQTWINFEIRDQSHASRSSITSLMVCNSFTCFPALDVVHFQRFPCGSSLTDSIPNGTNTCLTESPQHFTSQHNDRKARAVLSRIPPHGLEERKMKHGPTITRALAERPGKCG